MRKRFATLVAFGIAAGITGLAVRNPRLHQPPIR